jgi:hypothetical protein
LIRRIEYLHFDQDVLEEAFVHRPFPVWLEAAKKKEKNEISVDNISKLLTGKLPCSCG